MTMKFLGTSFGDSHVFYFWNSILIDLDGLVLHPEQVF
jgi:hypothetical protein